MKTADLATTSDRPKAEKGSRIPDSDLSLCLAIYKRALAENKGVQGAYKEAGALIGRDYKVVERALKRLLPTTDLARATLEAGAIKLAKRIVSKASVGEAIEVLSRPNIAALDPKQVNNEGGGFFLSIKAEDCGAVNVGIAQQNPTPRQLPGKV